MNIAAIKRKRIITNETSAKNIKIKKTNLTKANASYAQQRIWLHEKLYFHQTSPVYNVPAIFQINHGTLSIQRFRFALLNVIKYNSVLRTAYKYNSNTNHLEQHIKLLPNKLDDIEHDEYYLFQLTTYDKMNDEFIKELLSNEWKRNYFDLDNGFVLRCHIIKLNNNDNDTLNKDDIIMLNLHHIVFDASSFLLLLNSLKSFYDNLDGNYFHKEDLQYIDYSVYEEELFKNDHHHLSSFWRDLFSNYDFNQKLPIPYSSLSSKTEGDRSGLALLISFELEEELVEQIIQQMNQMNLSLFQLMLTCYFIFLYKLTQQQDLCIGFLNANRYHYETQSMIGMFVNTLPFRFQIEPKQTFEEIAEKLKATFLQIMNYAHVPYQEILQFSQRNHSLLSFIQTTLQLLPIVEKTDFLLNNNQTILQKLTDIYNNQDNIDEQSLTYSELLYYVELVSHSLGIKAKEIVCQCIDRSIEMIIGILSILMCGGIYCPLSSNDPQQRLFSLIKETNSTCILVHYLSQEKFNTVHYEHENNQTFQFISIEQVIFDGRFSMIKANNLTNINISEDDVAYILFTSGSTGLPKAGQFTHKNFTVIRESFKLSNMLNSNDMVLQISQCSFDFHLLDILGSLTFGATIIMLHRHGHLNINYLVDLIEQKTITFIFLVPSVLLLLCQYIETLYNANPKNMLNTLRCLLTGGETVLGKTVEKIMEYLSPNCHIFNFYGPSECTIGSTYHLITKDDLHFSSIPIGQPLPGYQCLVLDDYLQQIPTDSVGELFIGGKGVFSGYLNQSQLTQQVLIQIGNKQNNEKWYRSGDLVRYDKQGLLHFIGRKDFQIKLRGQRIELNEIEQIIMKLSSSSFHISNCLVMKSNDHEYLIGYIQTINTKDLTNEIMKDYCQEYLPQYMIPSLFIFMEQFPLNQNGKVDRKQLLSIDHHLLLTSLNDLNDEPKTQLENEISEIWCEMFERDKISMTTSFFSLGGNSLLLMKLFSKYQMKFDFNGQISELFVESTIKQHAKLVSLSKNRLFEETVCWKTLNIVEDLEKTEFHYIDYSQHERDMDMTNARNFWTNLLNNYDSSQQLNLLSTSNQIKKASKQRSGFGSHINISLENDLIEEILKYSKQTQCTLFQLMLTCYFIFLYKLTQQQDLCIGFLNANRYHYETQSMIGMFVNTLPFRFQIEPAQIFDEILKQIQSLLFDILQHGYLPYQEILKLHSHVQQQSLPFIQTIFLFHEIQNQSTFKIAENTTLENYDEKINNKQQINITKFDLTLNINHYLEKNHIDISFEYAIDVFQHEIIMEISQRFHLSERSLDQIRPIHHLFLDQSQLYSQKLSIILDEQSLTYSELLYYVELLSHSLDIKAKEIVCQCIDRSIEMIIGILSILMCGGIYCPLSPNDPQQRLFSLINETKAKHVLYHELTKRKFNELFSKTNCINIQHEILMNNNSKHDFELLSHKQIIEDIAYCIFTSGSTGLPKGAQISHRNFVFCIRILNQLNMFNSSDTMLQITPCSFDIHVQEILGSLVIGSCLIMLKPNGNLDLSYLAKTIDCHQATYMHSVPTHFNILIDYLIERQKTSENTDLQCFQSLRICCSSGEAIKSELVRKLFNYLPSSCQLINLYGPAECTIDSTYHLITKDDLHFSSIPIGRPLPGYQCLVLDDYLQQIPTDSVGELFIGGKGVFCGYLNQSQLTQQVLIEIGNKQNNEKWYRSGDLVRYDKQGLIHFIGRKDFQIKLRGQRIELNEIEQIIMKSSSSSSFHISNCLVMKSNDHEYLIGYIQTINTKDLTNEIMKDYCQEYLPQYMIPSLFIFMEQFPLNQNGKIDRKQLLSIDHHLLLTLLNDLNDEPKTRLENEIYEIWCEMFERDKISMTTSFFSLGGNSLLLMKLFSKYQMKFDFNGQISELFVESTIKQHAKLISLSKNRVFEESVCWKTLNIIEGEASYAQERIWLDEQMRFSKEDENNRLAIYNMPYLYKIRKDHGKEISIDYLRRSLEFLLEKHSVLRTALIYSSKDNCLKQRIQPLTSTCYIFEMTTIVDDYENELRKILNNEQTTNYFNLKQGLVFRCHLIKQVKNNDDYIIFNIHHIAFDGYSFDIFLNDFQMVFYHEKFHLSEQSLNYIDYAQYERQMNMIQAKDFWLKLLNENSTEYNQLSLPYDYHLKSSKKQRSGFGSFVKIDLDEKLINEMIIYSNQYKLTLFQLCLTCYFIFLFKLIHNEKHICLHLIHANRYRQELETMIGMFVNILPCHIQIQPQETFDKTMKQIRNIVINIMEYSYLPYQEIVEIYREKQILISEIIPFLFNSLSNTETFSLMNNDTNELFISKFDFLLTINFDSYENTMNCLFQYSSDLFKHSTIEQISQRFEIFLKQIFTSTFNKQQQSMIELSLILPYEQEIINGLTLPTYSYKNQFKSDYIHHLFLNQSQLYSQKLSIILDEQSLTYSELLYYVELVSHSLDIKAEEIVCQCIDRSIEMIIGILSILMCGGIYCPLSPNDPPQRLLLLINETKSKYILIHQSTENKFDDKIRTELSSTFINIEQIYFNSQINLKMKEFPIKTHSIAYCIFTSGSTGIPKIIQLKHENFLLSLNAYFETKLFDSNVIYLQLSQCTFDVHMEEILGTLTSAGTLVLCHSKGNLDFQYVSHLMQSKQVTRISLVPSYAKLLGQYWQRNNQNILQTLKRVSIGGGQLYSSTVNSLIPFLNEKCHLYNFYGPAETTITSTIQLITNYDNLDEHSIIPIGRPLPGYQCLILDDYLQQIPTDSVGELFIGGKGVFSGYLNQSQLTQQVLIQIGNKQNNEKWYRSGDLVRYDKQGLIHFIGRKDFQIKLRGQRIELNEIEQIIMKLSSSSSFHISNCLVMKSNDHEYLIGYIQTINTKDLTNEIMKDYCQEYLPPYMIPSLFIFMEQFPLNQNGKVDRKQLPKPDFDRLIEDNNDPRSLICSTELEQKLHDLFIESFHLSKTSSINICRSFFELGGTSLMAMHLLTLIREQIYANMDVNLLYSNPSIHQLATILQPLIESSSIELDNEINDDIQYPKPNLIIETIGVIMLVVNFLFPIYFISNLTSYVTNNSLLTIFLYLILVPIMHLMSYIFWKNLLGGNQSKGKENLFSLKYYRYWFIHQIWKLNSFWLEHVIELLDIDDNTFISFEVVMTSISYQLTTYELHRIQIGSSCLIDIRSVLYNGVHMENNVFVKSMSSVTGYIKSHVIIDGYEHNQNDQQIINENIHQSKLISLYQLICLIFIICLHGIIIQMCFYSKIYFFFSLSICFILWSFLCIIITLILLKYCIGNVKKGCFHMNSWYFVHKFWLRQLIVHSFGYSFKFFDGYHNVYPKILQWLGTIIQDQTQIKIADFNFFLKYPSNLLKLNHHLTTVGKVLFVPFNLNPENSFYCSTDDIQIDHNTMIGNCCTIHPGTKISNNTMIGAGTRLTNEIDCNETNRILLGIPAKQMPFKLPEIINENDKNRIKMAMKSKSIFQLICQICIEKYLIIYIYLSCSSIPFISSLLFLIFYSILVYLFEKFINEQFNFMNNIKINFIRSYSILIGRFLESTQFYIILLNYLGCQIGQNVIITDYHLLYDFKYVTIEDNCRIHLAYIQSHTYEQRLFKLKSCIIGQNTIMYPHTIVLSGAHLDGNNILYPLTLIMKDDHLKKYEKYQGYPARRVVF
ncbi:hypothetical protein I4U23_004507 [Adineta vaga]|nr:hypothetical protein I4U23_004507 [Adineta vaga]